MTDKIKIGVIGLGMGRSHITNFQKDDRVTVVAIADTDATKLAASAKEFNIEHTFLDAVEMMQSGKIDAVSIAVPNAFHKSLSVTGLEAGLHVLCEKPMAMNLEEAMEMKNVAEKTGKNLMINFSYRCHPTSQSLKAQVELGKVGPIYFGRTVWHRRRGMPGFGGWFGNKALSGGGPLIDLGVHRLDLALWLMGNPNPISVSGSTYDPIARAEADRQNKHYSVEDCAAGMVRFDNGATLLVEASWAINQKDPEHMITQLYGTKGGLVQRNVGGGYQFEAELYLEEQGSHYTQKLDIPADVKSSTYAEFISSIVEKRPSSAPPEHGIAVQKILDGLYQSAKEGREIRFDN